MLRWAAALGAACGVGPRRWAAEAALRWPNACAAYPRRTRACPSNLRRRVSLARSRRLLRRPGSLYGALSPDSPSGGRRSLASSSPARGATRLFGQGAMGCSTASLTFQSLARSSRPLGSGLAARRCAMTSCIVAGGALASSLRGLASARRRQLHARAARLGQTDCNRLPGRARSVLALADVIQLLLDELSRLRAGSLALALVPPRPLYCLFLWHIHLLRLRVRHKR